MDARHGKTRSCKSRQTHVKRLLKPGIVEHGLYWVYVKILSVDIVKAGRAIHPGISCYHQDAGHQSADAHDHTRKPVKPPVEPVPAI